MPGQRRMAISRLRVPNLDGAVLAAACNFFAIGAPRHWFDPEIVRSQDTNKQKQRGKNLGKLTNSSARSLGIRKRTFWNLWHLNHFRAYVYQQKVTFSSSLYSQVFNSTKENVFFVIFLSCSSKKRTCTSGRSGSIGNRQIASPKSWWFYHRWRWQFAFRRGSTPLIWPCNREQWAHESTEIERGKLEKKQFTNPCARSKSWKKTYKFECPVSVDWHSPDCESQILMVLS